MRTADQASYDAVFEACELTGVPVYHAPPNASAVYPYIVVTNVQVVHLQTKSHLLGRCYVDVDVWGNDAQRRQVSDLADRVIRNVGVTRVMPDGLNAQLEMNQTSREMLIDNSTNQNLWRARLVLAIAVS